MGETLSHVSIRKPINDRIIHDSRATNNEIIGLLLGRLEKDVIIIEDAVSGEFSSEPTRVQLSPSTLAKIADDIVSGRVKGNIIGWYHSHPTGGLFFSDTDAETQKIFQQFSRLTVGMVVDTATGRVGYFRVDHDGRPYRVPDENIRIHKAKAEATPQKRAEKPLIHVNKSVAKKIVLSGILITLVVAVALVGVVIYRTINQSIVSPINHTPILTAIVNQPIIVTANSTGTFQSVTLFYETTGSTSFTSAVMISPTSGGYQYTIPGSHVNGDITYYITAANANGINASTPVYHIQVADFLPELTNSTLTIYRNSTKPVLSQLTLKPINGFRGKLSISTQAPDGVAVTFPANVQSGTSVEIGITAGADAQIGTFPIAISTTYAPLGSEPITHKIIVQATVTDFTLQLVPQTSSVFAGQETTYNVTLTVEPGFSSFVPIQLKELNLPPGVKAQVFSTGTVLYGQGSRMNSLQIATATTTRPGTYTIVVVATATLDTGDYIAHSQTIQLTVR